MISFAFRKLTSRGRMGSSGKEQGWERRNLSPVQGRDDKARQEHVPVGQRGWPICTDRSKQNLRDVRLGARGHADLESRVAPDFLAWGTSRGEC